MQVLLDSSQSAYAQLLACSSLLKVVTEHTLRCAVEIAGCIWVHQCHLLHGSTKSFTDGLNSVLVQFACQEGNAELLPDILAEVSYQFSGCF
jgi:hypothetical protein